MSQVSRQVAIAAMKTAPMFSALDDAALGLILDGCRMMRVKAGEMIFGPTQKAQRFFIVLTGRVKIFMLSPRGDEQILHIYGPGETFGEAAFFTEKAGGKYPAFAQALADAELAAPFEKGREELRRAIRSNPEIAIGML